MKKILMALTIVLIIGTYFYYQLLFKWNEDLKIKSDPVVTQIDQKIFPAKDNCKVKTTNHIEFAARVLAMKEYSHLPDSDIVPMDIVFGWDLMSQDKIISRVSIEQNTRWFYYKFDPNEIDFSHEDIKCSFDNFHIIPGNSKVKGFLSSLKEGEAVKIKGYLADLECMDFERYTSLSWCDRSPTSCEQLLIESIEYLNEDSFDNMSFKRD